MPDMLLLEPTPRPACLVSEDALNELAQAAWRAPAGDFVEVGVYKGGSAWVLGGVARERGRALWLFDTFAGMPHAEPLDVHQKGEFADTSAEAVQRAIPDARLVVGVFPKTLKEAEAEGLARIALAHIDCDQYRSVRACCERLAPLMAPGGLMVFDDYVPLAGARKAVDEAFGARVRVSPAGRAWVHF